MKLIPAVPRRKHAPAARAEYMRSHAFTISFPIILYNRMNTLANEQQMSLSALIRQACMLYLKLTEGQDIESIRQR